MNIRTLTLVLGSALTVAAAGMGASACSSSSSGGGGTGSSSGGKTDGGSSSGSSSSGSSSGTASSSGSSSGTASSSGGGGDAGPDCGSTPSLHANAAGDIYCGFSDAGSLDCPIGQQCCLGGKINGTFAPEACGTWNGACTNGANPDSGTGNTAAINIQCNQVSDCVANGNHATACCLQGASAPAAVAGCGYDKSQGGNSIVCEGDGGPSDVDASFTATACAAGEIQICSSQADCPTSTTCTAGKWKIYQIGFCL